MRLVEVIFNKNIPKEERAIYKSFGKELEPGIPNFYYLPKDISPISHIYFRHKSGEYRVLSNFQRTEIEYQGQIYNSSEQFYQLRKLQFLFNNGELDVLCNLDYLIAQMKISSPEICKLLSSRQYIITFLHRTQDKSVKELKEIAAFCSFDKLKQISLSANRTYKQQEIKDDVTNVLTSKEYLRYSMVQMYKILLAKFEQDIFLRRKLLETENKLLCEIGRFYCERYTVVSLNLLGNCLCFIRQYLKKQ